MSLEKWLKNYQKKGNKAMINFFIYDLPKDQLVIIDYKKALREAKYLGGKTYYSNPNTYMLSMFDIAGVGYVELCPREVLMYYSLKDAQNCENAIKVKELSVYNFNAGLKRCVLEEDSGNLKAWVWEDTHPEFSLVKYRRDWSATWVDNHVESIIDMKTNKPMEIPNTWYRTREECIANNEAKVITF